MMILLEVFGRGGHDEWNKNAAHDHEPVAEAEVEGVVVGKDAVHVLRRQQQEHTRHAEHGKVDGDGDDQSETRYNIIIINYH
jgi:hypothetical protein